MSERSPKFRWTWVINQVSLPMIWLMVSTAADFLIQDLDTDAWYAFRLKCYAALPLVLGQTGLYLYARRKGGMQAIEPPAEVYLFWWLLMVVVLAAFIFGGPALEAILGPEALALEARAFLRSLS